MRKRWWSLLLIVISIPCLFAGGWSAFYGGQYDPKNIAFLLWKQDLWKIDKDRALSIMTHADAYTFVVGKTRNEIADKLGPFTPVTEASAYVRGCASQKELMSGDSVMLRRSEWMVTFSGDRATKLTLIKGC